MTRKYVTRRTGTWALKRNGRVVFRGQYNQCRRRQKSGDGIGPLTAYSFYIVKK